jgi:hypothetical protein
MGIIGDDVEIMRKKQLVPASYCGNHSEGRQHQLCECSDDSSP